MLNVSVEHRSTGDHVVKIIYVKRNIYTNEMKIANLVESELDVCHSLLVEAVAQFLKRLLGKPEALVLFPTHGFNVKPVSGVQRLDIDGTAS